MAVCLSCAAELPAAARFCPACGTPVAARVGEERKVVTVLFADLVGSTAAGDGRDPEDVRAAVQPQLTRMREELERFGGTFEKYIGDAVMAVFGAPVAREDDPERAVRAALAIRDAVPGARAAVHTGEAVVSLAAASGTGEGIATGDVVNTAYRIEEAAPDGTVLVGEPTYRATQEAIEYGERRLLQPKGKAEPVAVYEALRPRSDVPAASERRPLAPLVGRRQELSLVLDTIARARRDRTVQLVTLIGVPGIGKSRLIWELERAVVDYPGLVTWRRGRCLPYGDGVTFWALAEIVKAQAGILETDQREEAAMKLRRAVRDLIADYGEADWVEDALRPLVGLASRALPDEKREELFDGWRRFFEALAEWGPLVLVCEDVHWADERLLDFLDHLGDWGRGSMVVLCSARPELHERRPNWGARANAVTVALPPLTVDETGALVRYLLRKPRLTDELQGELLERAEGNPLYAEEFVRMLHDRGELRDEVATLQLDTRLSLPESVQGLIAARLDALPTEEKALLQDAAVIGRTCWPGAVAAMAGLTVEEATDRLRVLERKEVVRAHRPSSIAGELEYVFHHSLVRDVAYRQVPRAQRSAKHLAAANWLEAVAAERQDRTELLAHHLWKAAVLARAAGEELGSLHDRAISALREAGERAYTLNSFEPAANYFGAALDLGPAEEDEPIVRFCLAKARFRVGEAEQPFLEETRAELLAREYLREAAECDVMLGEVAWRQGRRREGFEQFERAAELLRDAPASASKAYVLSNLSRIRVAADEPVEALRLARDALEIAEELDLTEMRANALNTIGIARTISGDVGGLADLERSIELAVEANSPEAVRGYFNLGSVVANLGDLRRAFELHAEGRQLADRFGDVTWIEWFRAEQLYESYWTGRWNEAVALANELSVGAATATARRVELDGALVRGWIALARADLDAAVDDAERALGFSREADEPQNLYPALVFQARTSLAAGEPRTAGRLVDELLDRLRNRPSLASFWALELAFVLVQLRRERDFPEIATTPTRWLEAANAVIDGDFARAADLCAEIGTVPDEAHARLCAGRAGAKSQLERAHAFYRSVGAVAEDAARAVTTAD